MWVIPHAPLHVADQHRVATLLVKQPIRRGGPLFILVATARRMTRAHAPPDDVCFSGWATSELASMGQ